MTPKKSFIAFAIIAAAFTAWSCKKSEPETTVIAPKNVQLYEYTETSLTFAWDLAAGASSYTAQILKTSNAVSPAATLTTDSKTDVAEFSSLAKNTRFYFRVRSNYPGSKYSDWVYLMDSKGDTAKVYTGKGIVEGEITPTKVTCTAKLMSSTTSTVTVAFSSNAFADRVADCGYNWKVELFKDLACKDMVVGWTINADKNIFSATAHKYMTPPQFIFSSLTPGTTYYFRCKRLIDAEITEDSEYSTVIPVATLASMPAAKTTANVGDVVISESFDKIPYGGDLNGKAAGYSRTDRSTLTANKVATGDNPDVADAAFYLCDASVEMGLFTTLKGCVSDWGLKDWGYTNAGGGLYNRAGYVKMNGAKEATRAGALVLPAVSQLPGPSTVDVQFDASIYREAVSDVVPAIEVYVISEYSENDADLVTVTTQRTAGSIVPTADDSTFHTYNVEVTGLVATDRLAIGSSQMDATGRFMLDNIKVTIKSTTAATKLETPSGLDVKADGFNVTASWNAVADAAKGYTVAYKKSSDADFTEIVTTETSFAFKGDYSTSYDVKVKANSYDSKYDSDYTAVATTITGEAPAVLPAPTVTAGAAFKDALFFWPPVTGATGYTVVFNNGAETVVADTSYTATSLNQGETYSFKVRANGATAESNSPYTEATVTTNTVKQYNASPTTVTIDWGWSQLLNPGSRAYEMELASSAEESAVFQDWKFTYYTSSKSTGYYPYPCRFTFATTDPDKAIAPATTYYARVRGTDPQTSWSDFLAVKTADAFNVPSNAVFYEGFDKVYWGGDMSNLATSTHSNDSKNVTSLKADSILVVSCTSDGSGLFNTYSADMRALMGLGDWTCDTTANVVLTHPGYLKLGIGTGCGMVNTPAMSKLGAATDCILNFDACSWYGATSATTLAPDANQTIRINVKHADGTLTTVTTITLAKRDEPKFETYKVNISGLLPTDRIQFRAITPKNNRFMIDNVLVVPAS